MSAETMIEHCNTIIGKKTYEPANIVRSEPIRYSRDNIDDVLSTVKDLGGCEGWLCFQSGVHRVRKGDDLQALPTNLGYVLSGELVQGDKTMSIQQSNDQWYVSFIEENATGNPAAQIVICTNRRQCVLSRFSKERSQGDEKQSATSNASPSEYAEYRVFFTKNDDDSGYEPFCYRFAGFYPEEERTL